MRLLLLVITSILLASCGRFAPGLIITDDGRTIANNDENNRHLVVEDIRTQLDEQLGGHWRTVVTLPELPVYAPSDSRLPGDEGWLWMKATVTLELVGDGCVPQPITTEALHKAVVKYLSPKVERPERNLTVTVTSAIDAARFAALTKPIPAPGSAPVVSSVPVAAASAVAPAGGPRRYTVQAGDTLADISAVFYGSAQHWRLIRDANPGIDPGSLTAGLVLTIPAKP